MFAYVLWMCALHADYSELHLVGAANANKTHIVYIELCLNYTRWN